MSYGGYRHADQSIEPTVDELKEDMKLLQAIGIKIIRNYKVHLPEAENLLKAISELNVITSYSIHYTKLYEVIHGQHFQAPLPSQEAPMFQKVFHF